MNKKTLIISSCSVAAVAAVVVPIAVVSAKKHNNTQLNKNNEQNITPILNIENIYPKLNTHDFYQYIRYSNENVKFDKSIVNAVVNKVATSLSISPENLSFNYNFETDSKLTMEFLAKLDNNIYTHRYEFNAF
ncbi:MHO_1590 family protein [Mycoplasmopsis bovigenitalium]|uniref:MHO_1590 family protein n=1 Tax=Mycoplasmopsis bovigenitalium TaxID=2112 RepID=UPI0011E4D5DB|nr:hypothetical protein [Mycoplasmopsis bovigenitalium]